MRTNLALNVMAQPQVEVIRLLLWPNEKCIFHQIILNIFLEDFPSQDILLFESLFFILKLQTQYYKNIVQVHQYKTEEQLKCRVD